MPGNSCERGRGGYQKDCVLWGRAHSITGEQGGEEGAAEMTCQRLTKPSVPIPCAPRWGDQRVRNEIQPGAKGGVSGVLFSFVFIPHYPT